MGIARSVEEAQAQDWGKDLILKKDCAKCTEPTTTSCVNKFPNDLMLKSGLKTACETTHPCAVCGTPTQTQCNTLFPCATPTPPTQTQCNTLFPCVVCGDTKLGTKYIGNNGSVSGDTYCKGAWGSNAAKNMKCVGQYDVATKETLGCSQTAGKATDVYCINSTKYIGNNGSVSGDTYCKGAWGSNADKNMKCVAQYTLATNEEVPCAQTAGKDTNVYCV